MRSPDKLSRRAFLTAPLSRPAPSETGPLAEIADGCLAKRHIHCQACGDACPEAAIRFRPRVGGPPVPDLRVDACTGCGDCVPVCPAGVISIATPEDSRA